MHDLLFLASILNEFLGRVKEAHGLDIAEGSRLYCRMKKPGLRRAGARGGKLDA